MRIFAITLTANWPAICCGADRSDGDIKCRAGSDALDFLLACARSCVLPQDKVARFWLVPDVFKFAMRLSRSDLKPRYQGSSDLRSSAIAKPQKGCRSRAKSPACAPEKVDTISGSNAHSGLNRPGLFSGQSRITTGTPLSSLANFKLSAICWGTSRVTTKTQASRAPSYIRACSKAPNTSRGRRFVVSLYFLHSIRKSRPRSPAVPQTEIRSSRRKSGFAAISRSIQQRDAPVFYRQDHLGLWPSASPLYMARSSSRCILPIF